MVPVGVPKGSAPVTWAEKVMDWPAAAGLREVARVVVVEIWEMVSGMVAEMENSEVLPAESVAVEVRRDWPATRLVRNAVKGAWPAASVVTVMDPAKCLPSA